MGKVNRQAGCEHGKKPDRDFGPFRDGQSLPTALHVHRHQECRSRFVTHTAVHNVLDERGVSDEWEVAHGIAQTDGGWRGEARRGEARRGEAGRDEARRGEAISGEVE